MPPVSRRWDPPTHSAKRCVASPASRTTPTGAAAPSIEVRAARYHVLSDPYGLALRIPPENQPMSHRMNESQVRRWLADHDLSKKEIDDILWGIDTEKPMSIQWLWESEKLVQFQDLPSFGHPESPRLGNWFAYGCIHDDQFTKLGIGSGLAGRRRVEFEVARPIEALETTARATRDGDLPPGQVSSLGPGESPAMPTVHRYNGEGGESQLYVPNAALWHIRAAGG